MNIASYEILLKVLECGTLTRAAEELGYTQSGLTKMLNNLEEELGLQVLQRDRHGVRLTSEGSILLPHIKTLLGDHHRLLRCAGEINQLEKGLISIGTFNSVSAQWLPKIIKKFSTDYPGIRFQLLHGNNDQIVEWVQSSRIDLGFTRYGTAQEFDETFLYKDPIVGVFASDDSNTNAEKISLKKLSRLPYISLNEGVDDEITDILNKNNITLHPLFTESDDHAVIAMVEQGLGVSLMSRMMIQDFHIKITALPLDPPHCREIGIACKDKKLLSEAASVFWDYVISWISDEYVQK